MDNLSPSMEMFNLMFNNCQYKIVEARAVTVSDIWPNFFNFYPNNRIYLIDDGEATVFLKQKKLHLTPGHLYFIPAFSAVGCECKTYLTHHFLHFEPSSNFNNILEFCDLDYVVEESPADKILFDNIVEHFKDPSFSTKLSVEGSFKFLLAKFFLDSKLKNPAILRFSDVLTYIDEHLHEPISVSDLAKIINLDTTYFSNLFTKTFGIPPLQYMIQKRINRSINMLVQEQYTIREIAYAVGFNNELYFSRLFKEKVGCSPLHYRKKLL